MKWDKLSERHLGLISIAISLIGFVVSGVGSRITLETISRKVTKNLSDNV